ncbi:MAG: AAA family ATPase [Clostridiales bacterium]|nr:AAA family ATPase [Clostridiales bacterium]
MRIKKMTAAFGALDNAVLEPGDGLTVITAPNEAGKSTWAGFLKAMLYGIDTRERDKTGFLADKTRYQPWSGAPMSGELQVEWQGKDITIRRFPTRTNPFGGFEAVYTASGDPVPGLTAANVGEQLTGVGKEVYLRSAFVGQGGTAIGASKELEARVAALATSGQEDVSYSAVERTLKDWRNRRRANRANGLIPQLEEEKSNLDSTLREMEQTRRRRVEAEQELARLEEKQREIQSDLEIWARLERHDLNRRYAEAYMEWEAAQANLPKDKPHPVFGTMSGEEAWAFAQEKQEEREAAEEENRHRESQRAETEKQYATGRQEMLMGGILGACMLLMVAAQLLASHWPLAALACAVVLCGIYCFFHGRKLMRHARDEQTACQPVPVPETGDLLNQAAEYRETLAAAQQARAAEAAARRRVDDLAAQGGQLFDTLEMLYPPAQSKAATAAQLSAVERELARVRDDLARTEGILTHMGGRSDIEARRGELDVQLTRRLEEYDALTTALEALSAANDALRQRFSPALNQKAGELFAALTGGRWPRLTLARDFSAQAAAEDTLPRSSLALSTGTAEQLYLAVRLAVCALTVPGAPIVLDDALTAFDDARCALALALLKEQARDRQILLFSCHGREAGWATAHDVPVIQL